MKHKHNFLPSSYKQYNNINLKQISLFFILNILHSTEVRGFRIILQKPVNGQRTNSNMNTIKRLTSLLYQYKYNRLAGLSPINLTKPIFAAEYINLFWQQQWVYEWVSGYRMLKKLPLYIQKTNFIDITNINLYNIYNFYQNPFKKSVRKSQKRKKVIPKNKFATGYPFGFSISYATQLNNIN